ncbi:MAG: assimilatory sulfite reductase (NADPH) flavoprotein subunit [Pseudomonadota bacterium]
MTQHFLAPGLSPLTPEQTGHMEALLSSLNPVQQAWISGYLAATATAGAGAVPAPAPAPVEAAVLTILYGSQTGNAKHVAQDLHEKSKARGLETRLVNMADYKPTQLKDEKFLAIVVSTYGEGEPPEPAQKLYDFIGSKKAPKLDGAQIAVLGLGDTSYDLFCQTALDFEERLVALGAKVTVEKALLDVDYDDHTEGWFETALDTLEPELKSSGATPQNNVVALPGLAPAPVAAAYSKKAPFEAEISAVQKITGRDSTKDVRHLEISLEGSGLTYRPGDALGVYFENDPTEIDEILGLLELDGAAEIELSDGKKPLRDALVENFELTQSYPGFVASYAEATGNEALAELADDKDKLRDYLADRQIYDVIRDHPAPITPDALASSLRKIQPRLYSIASSQAEVEDEVHLTLGVVSYDAFDRAHLGGASGHLGHRTEDGSKVRVYVEENDGFRLPNDPNVPVIMVGPGTGIAPFRAFLQQREVDGADGKNWLFFGNPRFTQDFLYQTELQGYLKSGLLSELSVAFSRDQKEKIYVQDRLRERGADLYQWLENGAHFYVCGDANRMAKDVEQALLEVLAEHGHGTEESATAYLQALKDAGRYQRDIY